MGRLQKFKLCISPLPFAICNAAGTHAIAHRIFTPASTASANSRPPPQLFPFALRRARGIAIARNADGKI
jgi:hypothetical protein